MFRVMTDATASGGQGATASFAAEVFLPFDRARPVAGTVGSLRDGLRR